MSNTVVVFNLIELLREWHKMYIGLQQCQTMHPLVSREIVRYRMNLEYAWKRLVDKETIPQKSIPRKKWYRWKTQNRCLTCGEIGHWRDTCHVSRYINAYNELCDVETQLSKINDDINCLKERLTQVDSLIKFYMAM